MERLKRLFLSSAELNAYKIRINDHPPPQFTIHNGDQFIIHFRHQWTIDHFDRLLSYDFERFPPIKTDFECDKNHICYVTMGKISAENDIMNTTTNSIDYVNDEYSSCIDLFINVPNERSSMVYSVSILNSSGKRNFYRNGIYL